MESSCFATTVGMAITEIVLRNYFWKNEEHILNACEFLVTVLHLVDSEDKPHHHHQSLVQTILGSAT